MKPTNTTVALVCAIFGILLSGPACLGLSIASLMLILSSQPDLAAELPPRFSGFMQFFIGVATVQILLGIVSLLFGIMIYRGSERPIGWLRPLAYGLYVYAAAIFIVTAIADSSIFTGLLMGAFAAIFPTTIILMLQSRYRTSKYPAT